MSVIKHVLGNLFIEKTKGIVLPFSPECIMLGERSS